MRRRQRHLTINSLISLIHSLSIYSIYICTCVSVCNFRVRGGAPVLVFPTATTNMDPHPKRLIKLITTSTSNIHSSFPISSSSSSSILVLLLLLFTATATTMFIFVPYSAAFHVHPPPPPPPPPFIEDHEDKIISDDLHHLQEDGQDWTMVQKNGNQFILNAQPFYVNGFNTYWLMVFAADDSTRGKVTHLFHQASSVGLTVCRTWAFNDAQWRALQISPSLYDEQVFQVSS